MVKEYYIKDREDLVAYLRYNEELDLWSMEILEPSRMKGYTPKLCLTDELTRKWIDHRLTPEYQRGYVEKMRNIGLDPYDPKHRMELFFKSRGCYATDFLWLAYTEDEPYCNAPIFEVDPIYNKEF